MIGRSTRCFVKYLNMDYTFLSTEILFRDIMIILLVNDQDNVGRVGIWNRDYHFKGDCLASRVTLWMNRLIIFPQINDFQTRAVFGMLVIKTHAFGFKLALAVDT
jgi:hypothetical protein